MAAVLTTDGGPHSAETWAMASTEQLFQSMVPAGKMRPLDLQRAEVQVAQDLVAIYQKVQDHERDRLSVGTVLTGFDIEPYLEDIVKTIQNAVAETKYQFHFRKQEVVDWIKQMCGQHIADMQHIERLWHQGANN